MNHSVSNDAIGSILQAIYKNTNWMSYNSASFELEKSDLYFFHSKDEADQHASNNISEYDYYSVAPIYSLADALKVFGVNQHLTENNLSILNNTTMNQKNFEYLKDQVKYTGFGDELENQLKEKIQKEIPEFKLSHQTKFGTDTVDAILQFKKSDQSDMYFFNSYKVNLKKENSADDMQQTFYINRGNNITLKEAYNLMNGRAVNMDLTNKENQMYNAWLQMDFKQTDNNGNYKLKQFHQNYGFDLEKELSKHPIRELTNEQDKASLIKSLEKGNRQSVTFQHEGGEQKKFIEANPQFKTINIYDSNMQQRVANKQSKDEKQDQAESNTTKQNTKKETESQSDDEPDLPKAKKRKSKKQNQSMS